MGLQRVTITTWPSSLMARQESEGVHSKAASPWGRNTKKRTQGQTGRQSICICITKEGGNVIEL